MTTKLNWYEFSIYSCATQEGMAKVYRSGNAWLWCYKSDDGVIELISEMSYDTNKEAMENFEQWCLEPYTIHFDVPVEMAVKSGNIIYPLLEKPSINSISTSNSNVVIRKSIQYVLDELKALNLSNNLVETFEFDGHEKSICHIRKLSRRDTLCGKRVDGHISFYFNQDVSICEDCVNKLNEKKKDK